MCRDRAVVAPERGRRGAGKPKVARRPRQPPCWATKRPRPCRPPRRAPSLADRSYDLPCTALAGQSADLTAQGGDVRPAVLAAERVPRQPDGQHFVSGEDAEADEVAAVPGLELEQEWCAGPELQRPAQIGRTPEVDQLAWPVTRGHSTTTSDVQVSAGSCGIDLRSCQSQQLDHKMYRCQRRRSPSTPEYAGCA